LQYNNSGVCHEASYADGSAKIPDFETTQYPGNHDPHREDGTRSARSKCSVSSQTSPGANEDFTLKANSYLSTLPENLVRFDGFGSVCHICDERQSFGPPSKLLRELADIKHITLSNLYLVGKIKEASETKVSPMA